MLLVARNDQPGAEIHKVLHALLAAQRQFLQSAFTPNCVHSSNGSLALKTLLALSTPWSHIDHLRSQTPWCSKTISQNTLWHTWLLIRLQRLLPGFGTRCFISIFRALARLLSDHGSNFVSSIIAEMCKLLGMKKLQTTPYHPQTNGLVERSHQTIKWMIGKLGEDKKANWPSHLAEIVHAYNANQSAVMGYSPYYLMFWCQSRLPVDLYFPNLKGVQRGLDETPPPGMLTKM